MQDGQLDTFGCMNHVPERESEQPGRIIHGLRCRDECRRAEGELLAA